jgi:PadR family transcriptional regulator PadR
MDSGKLSALRKGLLEPLILAIASSEKVYVADIVERLGATDFATKEGTLYPLLSKMRRERLLDYEWRESASGPPRKYYGTTAAGRRELATTREYLASITELIDELRNEHAPSG